MWKKYNVHTTREDIVMTAQKPYGGFVNTDGAWVAADNPEDFKAMLEHFFGFEVVECKETTWSTAVATTKCGLHITWNGHCDRVQDVI